MKNKHILEAIIICLLTLIAVSASIPEVGAMAPDTRLRIEPADLVVSLNETFVVNVVVEEANDLAAFEFDLAYDPSILQVTKAAASDFLKSTGNSMVAVGPEVNDAAGRITFGAISFGNAAGPSGTGVLATVTCVAKGEGSTTLELREVQVLDTAAGAQRVTVADGRVVVRGSGAAMPIATTTPAPMDTPRVVDTPTPPATALPSPTPAGTSSWALPALVLAALATAILAIFILSRRPGD
jgi:general secretion pathway protein D